MAEIQTAQINGGSPPSILTRLRRLKKEFETNIQPELKAKNYFISKSEERRKKTKRPSRQRPDIRFSPFAMTLGSGLSDVRPPISRSRLVRTAIAPNQAGQLISVFIIAMIKTDPPVYVLQGIQKKSAPGFPGGRIENGETILEAAAREFREESNGGDPSKGVDITPYNPLCIGKFVLSRAVSGEQGAVILVEIPESEIENLKAGGGGEEGKIVEELFLMTFDEIAERVKSRTILPNSGKIWDLYLNHLISMP